MFKALLLTQPVPRETRAECVELDLSLIHI